MFVIFKKCSYIAYFFIVYILIFKNLGTWNASWDISPLMQTLWTGSLRTHREHSRVWSPYLARCVLGIGTVLGLRLMTYNEYASTQVQTRTQTEKRPKNCVTPYKAAAIILSHIITWVSHHFSKISLDVSRLSVQYTWTNHSWKWSGISVDTCGQEPEQRRSSQGQTCWGSVEQQYRD